MNKEISNFGHHFKLWEVLLCKIRSRVAENVDPDFAKLWGKHKLMSSSESHTYLHALTTPSHGLHVKQLLTLF